MADKVQSRRGGGRGVALGLLAILVALLVAYLGRCLPGFGVGGSSPSSSEPAGPPTDERPKDQPHEPADDEPVPAPAALEVTVSGDDCRRGDEALRACDAVCQALAGEPDKARPVVVHAALGTHVAVETVRQCLAKAGFADVVVRTE